MPLFDEQKNKDYLRQVIVVRKDLSMPTGKLAAMVAHASMSFITSKIEFIEAWQDIGKICIEVTSDQYQWLTELDPGLEEIGQISFAKIVLAANSEEELQQIYDEAYKSELETHKVYDSGYSHNPAGTFVAVAIGPNWPDKLFAITGHLKVYR
jgi:PTH2 family peptidyl-tRNA hydrolase